LEGLDTDDRAKERLARLEAFSHFDVEQIVERLGDVHWPPWPEIQGCFVILFTARSGSTFLCRELERVFDIGRMGESLNPGQVKGRPVADIVRERENAWFGFKAGLQGIVAAEVCGFFDAYLSRTVFIRLVRRDIVAQAVSFVKAAQTSQWHRGNAPRREPHYDAAAITKAIRKLSTGIRQLGDYAAGSQRPCLTLVYEDISEGDVTPAIVAGESLGLPRHPPGARAPHRPVERMSDAVNREWCERYRRDMDAPIRKRVDAHVDALGC
jgi:LPS sulfotransferase NodH